MTEELRPVSPNIDLGLIGDEHVRQYEETGGEIGYLWNGASCLVLSTTGRKSGAIRKSALICGFDGDACIIVGSMGGAPNHPAWYLNLTAEPSVTVQVKTDLFPATARVAEGSERERLWQLMCDLWPAYDTYQSRTERVIPVIILERSNHE